MHWNAQASISNVVHRSRSLGQVSKPRAPSHRNMCSDRSGASRLATGIAGVYLQSAALFSMCSPGYLQIRTTNGDNRTLIRLQSAAIVTSSLRKRLSSPQYRVPLCILRSDVHSPDDCVLHFRDTELINVLMDMHSAS